MFCCNAGGVVKEGISELVGHGGGFERPWGGERGPSQQGTEEIYEHLLVSEQTSTNLSIYSHSIFVL